VKKQKPLPERWLFTDRRWPAAAIVQALAGLPRGSGVVLRDMADADARCVVAAARRNGHVVVVSGDRRRVRRLGGAGRHLASTGPVACRVLTASAHNLTEIVRARRAGARLVFVSPVFPTASHREARPLGRIRFGLLARGAGVALAALGGMDARHFAQLGPLGAAAWGGIAAFMDPAPTRARTMIRS
jgi:thiamine-phosphate pyrophosphorylase